MSASVQPISCQQGLLVKCKSRIVLQPLSFIFQVDRRKSATLLLFFLHVCFPFLPFPPAFPLLLPFYRTRALQSQSIYNLWIINSTLHFFLALSLLLHQAFSLTFTYRHILVNANTSLLSFANAIFLSGKPHFASLNSSPASCTKSAKWVAEKVGTLSRTLSLSSRHLITADLTSKFDWIWSRKTTTKRNFIK